MKMQKKNPVIAGLIKPIENALTVSNKQVNNTLFQKVLPLYDSIRNIHLAPSLLTHGGLNHA